MSITFKLEKDGKKWHAYCPELHGCHTFGKTKEEALKNLKDAVMLYSEKSQSQFTAKIFQKELCMRYSRMLG